jgi:hypothetical protein
MKFQGPIAGRLAAALDYLTVCIRIGHPLDEILKESDSVLKDYFKYHSGRISTKLPDELQDND